MHVLIVDDDGGGTAAGGDVRRRRVHRGLGRLGGIRSGVKRLNSSGEPVVDDTEQASQLITDLQERMDYHNETQTEVTGQGQKSVHYQLDWRQRHLASLMDHYVH